MRRVEEKARQETVPDKETLQQSDKSEEGKGVQTSGKSGADNQNSILLEKLLQAHQTIAEEKEKRLQQLTEKDQTILDLETKKQTLENSLKLLPEGKSPEQLRREWEENYKIEKEKIKIVTEVRATGSLRFRKRKKLLNRLEELYN